MVTRSRDAEAFNLRVGFKYLQVRPRFIISGSARRGGAPLYKMAATLWLPELTESIILSPPFIFTSMVTRSRDAEAFNLRVGFKYLRVRPRFIISGSARRG
ncbi:hypothetical protein NDU88_002097 [Pleurodeles waltl]|uniref:Uncharacterized protein n=1 Tax=Pleurodeles waltl TaxID=8319 RepID=A0AAV7VC85_PLEWA|nr:hypothetical protein NDU88_002097 [Pleurodeles waltl]